MGGIYNSTPVARDHLIPNGETHYFEIPVSAAPFVGLQIIWHDATSAFDVEAHSTNQPPEIAATNSTDAEHWSDEAGITIPSVTAAAAGSNMVHLSGIGSRRLRIAITANANSRVTIRTHGKA